MSDVEKPGPFEASIDPRIKGMTAQLFGAPGSYVVLIGGFDGPMTLDQMRYARSLLTRGIQDQIRRDQLRLSNPESGPA